MTTKDIKEYLGTKIDIILDNDMLIYSKGNRSNRTYDTILWYNSLHSIALNIDVYDSGKCQIVMEDNQMSKLRWNVELMEDVILDHLIKAIKYQMEYSNNMLEFNYTDFKSKEFDRERVLNSILD
jgi:hypothetical protein